ncbi:DeoR family transcriptional regulator [Stappia sp. GBMRC 2046]|uniref:DeoR family transcriptional regulator n=1 Tax=Stappia sediminis TaxID=2692190 RepID=A0A7X3LUR2_9HYPH|nr:DeoR/GlpR family DNA-binding transcription regulator [Stappia sediminis]MXN65482.1 DeoR family transcriptional regulator [Stappia sediminis]
MRASMDISERQAEIAELVQAQGFLSVESLAERFGVTTQTIRRDVNGLCELGILRRTHGGVEPPPAMHNIHYRTRQILNLPAKQLIAATVAEYVPNDVSLAFSIGTTPEIVMQALMNHEALRVYTNNLNVAMAASANPGFDVTIVGGRLRHGDRDILGPATQSFFDSYKFDIGIFGVAGVDEDGTLLDFHEDEVLSRQAIRENSRRSFLVLDHTKFTRPAHVRGGHIGDVSHVFCDRRPPEAILKMLKSSNTTVVICGEEGEAD